MVFGWRGWRPRPAPLPDAETLKAHRLAYWAAYRDGRFDDLAGLAAANGELSESALFLTIDNLIFDGQEHRIPELGALAGHTKYMTRMLWRLISQHLQDDPAALKKLRDLPVTHRRAAGLNKAGPVWAAFLSAPRLSHDPAQGRGPEIMQFWDKSQVPDDVMAAITGWKRLAGDRHHLFDQQMAEDFLRDTYGPTEAAIMAGCPHPAIMCDYFRLGWLAAKGGLYVDADSVLRVTMRGIWPQMADRTVLWIRTHVPNGAISNGVMAARAGSPLMLRCFEEAGRRLAAGQIENVVGAAGPIMIRNIVAQAVREDTMEPFHAIHTAFARRLIYRALQADYKKGAGHWTTWHQQMKSKPV